MEILIGFKQDFLKILKSGGKPKFHIGKSTCLNKTPVENNKMYDFKKILHDFHYILYENYYSPSGIIIFPCNIYFYRQIS